MGVPAADKGRALRRGITRKVDGLLVAAKNATGRLDRDEFVFVVVHGENLASNRVIDAARYRSSERSAIKCGSS